MPKNKSTESIKLTQKRLKEVLDYNPDTGIFIWIKSRNHFVKNGSIAGCENADGYIDIQIDKKEYKAHRLAWLYMEGYTPEYLIDHINRIRNDNKWTNLRHVSKTCNIINTDIRIDNSSGIPGVCWHKNNKKWRSYIAVNKKFIHIGIFKSFTKAVYHRWKAEVKYNFHTCNSTSRAYLYLKNKGLI